jgi:hypothetical protein
MPVVAAGGWRPALSKGGRVVSTTTARVMPLPSVLVEAVATVMNGAKRESTDQQAALVLLS